MEHHPLQKKIYLGIAGFKIAFLFRLEDKSYVPAISSIMEYFRPFQIVLGDKEIDYTVEFISRDINPDKKTPQSITVKNSTYIKLCSEDKLKKRISVLFPLGIYEIELILRMIFFELLPQHHSFCIHASAAISPSGGAYIFLGDSGAGKSTIIRMIQKSFKPIFDDIGFIRKKGSEYYLYTSPYKEKNTYVKLPGFFHIEKVFFPMKSRKFSIQKVSVASISDLIKRINSQILVNTNSKDVLQFISAYSTQSFELHFSKNDSKIGEKIINYFN